MCTKKEIDDILRQIRKNRDSDQIRRLLKEMDTCNKCPENPRNPDAQELFCSCRQNFQTELKNHIYSITFQDK